MASNVGGLQQRLIQWAGASKLAEMNPAQIQAAAKELGVAPNEVLQAVLAMQATAYSAPAAATTTRLSGDSATPAAPTQQRNVGYGETANVKAFKAATNQYRNDGDGLQANEQQSLLLQFKTLNNGERSAALGFLLGSNAPATFETLEKWAQDNGEKPTIKLADFVKGLTATQNDGEFSATDRSAMLWAFSSLSAADKPQALALLLKQNLPTTFLETVKWAQDNGVKPKLEYNDFAKGLSAMQNDGEFSAQDKQVMLFAFSCLSGADSSKALGLLLSQNMPNTFLEVIKWAQDEGRKPTLNYTDFAHGFSAFSNDGEFSAQDKEALVWAFSSLSKPDASKALGLLLAQDMPNTFLAVAKWSQDQGTKPSIALTDFKHGVSSFSNDGDFSAQDQQAVLWAFSCLPQESRQTALNYVSTQGLSNTFASLAKWNEQN